MLSVLHLLKYLLPWCLPNCWDTSAVVAGISSDAKMRSGLQCESACVPEPEIARKQREGKNGVIS